MPPAKSEGRRGADLLQKKANRKGLRRALKGAGRPFKKVGLVVGLVATACATATPLCHLRAADCLANIEQGRQKKRPSAKDAPRQKLGRAVKKLTN